MMKKMFAMLLAVLMMVSCFAGCSAKENSDMACVKDNGKIIVADDLEEAMMKVIAGPPKHKRIITQHEQKLTAIHEAGHAIAMYHLKTHDPVHQITIIPRGGAGGMTISLPEEDQYLMVYHRHKPHIKDGNARFLCIDRMDLDEQGNILPVTMTAEWEYK